MWVRDAYTTELMRRMEREFLFNIKTKENSQQLKAKKKNFSYVISFVNKKKNHIDNDDRMYMCVCF